MTQTWWKRHSVYNILPLNELFDHLKTCICRILKSYIGQSEGQPEVEVWCEEKALPPENKEDRVKVPSPTFASLDAAALPSLASAFFLNLSNEDVEVGTF